MSHVDLSQMENLRATGIASPELFIKEKDKGAEWLTIDLRDDVDVGAVVVIPCFGANHHAGFDCWCHPDYEHPDMIVHNCAN